MQVLESFLKKLQEYLKTHYTGEKLHFQSTDSKEIGTVTGAASEVPAPGMPPEDMEVCCSCIEEKAEPVPPSPVLPSVVKDAKVSSLEEEETKPHLPKAGRLTVSNSKCSMMSGELPPYWESRSEASKKSYSASNYSENIRRLMEKRGKTFSEKLFELIDAKGLTEVEVYTRSNLDRRLFSKLRRKEHTPSKNTVFALIIGMKLNMAEAKDLLSYAGYTFKPSSGVDVIVSFFIEEENYNMYALNEVLQGYGLELLGNVVL